MSILIVILTAVLVLISAFVVLVILMQKPSANAGMGSALGGGAAEQAFGGNAANVLTRTTVFAIIGFFVLTFGLYLGNLAIADVGGKSNDDADALDSLVSSIEEDAPAVEETTTPEVSAEAQAAAAQAEAAAASLDDVIEETEKPTE